MNKRLARPTKEGPSGAQHLKGYLERAGGRAVQERKFSRESRNRPHEFARSDLSEICPFPTTARVQSRNWQRANVRESPRSFPARPGAVNIARVVALPMLRKTEMGHPWDETKASGINGWSLYLEVFFYIFKTR